MRPKRLLVILLAAVMTLAMLPSQTAGAYAASSPLVIDLSDNATYQAGANWSYTNSTGVYRIENGANVTIKGDTGRGAKRIVIASGAAVNITLDDATINRQSDTSGTVSACAFDASHATVNLTLVGWSWLGSGSKYAGIWVDPTSTLTIRGTGLLTARGGIGSAGIGGCAMGSSGKITIKSGDVRASGGTGGSGIGGGDSSGLMAGLFTNCGAITIDGGYVSASGGTGGAGFGGGKDGFGGAVTVNGGIVTGSGTAGFGGGEGSYIITGSLIINSGLVSAAGTTRTIPPTYTLPATYTYKTSLSSDAPPWGATDVPPGTPFSYSDTYKIIEFETRTVAVHTGNPTDRFYEANTFDLSAISGLFDVYPGSGDRIYSVEPGGTGAGTIGADYKTLTVTKAGTIKIGLFTYGTDTVRESKMCIATLTVNKGTGATVVTLPTAQYKTHDSIAVNALPQAANGQSIEYSINTTATPGTWQSGTTFNGLSMGTDYYVFARAKENDLYSAGTVVSNQITTSNVPLYVLSVNGGTGTGAYAAGATATITAGAAPSGQRFKSWSISPAVAFTDGTSATSATAKFTMLPVAVTATATYENIPNGNGDGGKVTTDPSKDTTGKTVLPKTKIKKITAAKKSVKLTFVKVNKKLKAGKRYQFRVRAWKTVGQAPYYAKWSPIKTSKKIR